MTRVPRSQGRSLLWDVTVVDTVAQSYLQATKETPGAAAGKAEEKKREKCASLRDRYIFAPIGLETFGSWGEEASALIKEIGRKLAQQIGEQRSTTFLIQRISIELQRGNASSIVGTFAATRGLEELFHVLIVS